MSVAHRQGGSTPLLGCKLGADYARSGKCGNQELPTAYQIHLRRVTWAFMQTLVTVSFQNKVAG